MEGRTLQQYYKKKKTKKISDAVLIRAKWAGKICPLSTSNTTRPLWRPAPCARDERDITPNPKLAVKHKLWMRPIKWWSRRFAEDKFEELGRIRAQMHSHGDRSENDQIFHHEATKMNLIRRRKDPPWLVWRGTQRRLNSRAPPPAGSDPFGFLHLHPL
jgi:hypothetical protein